MFLESVTSWNRAIHHYIYIYVHIIFVVVNAVHDLVLDLYRQTLLIIRVI